MKIRQLIDVAIGFPEPGHVNFSALHCLLICIAEKLAITDESLDFQNIDTDNVRGRHDEQLRRDRLLGGYTAEEDNDDESQPEPEEQSPTPIANINPSSFTANRDDDHEDANEAPNPVQSTLDKLEERVLEIETTVGNIAIPQHVLTGISVMKDQLEFVMEQMLLLTFLTLSKKPDAQHIQQLYSMTQTMLDLKKENIYIENFKQPQLPSASSLDWKSSGLQLNEDLLESDVLEVHYYDSKHDAKVIEIAPPDELDDHLCYSPAKLLDQLAELKGELARLANKVNEVASSSLENGSQRSLALIQEIQNDIHDMKQKTSNLSETHSRLELKVNSNQANIENTRKSIEQIFVEKVGKNDLEMQLANKVDYNQMQRKVSLDQVLELQCRIDKKFCDMLRQIKENDKKSAASIEELKVNLGSVAIDKILNNFKENIMKDIQHLKELLESLTASTDDDFAASAARFKVVQGLSCLSCNTNCVMRKMNMSKVAKLPSAHAHAIISPLITYELGSIRKSGLMGYYRKDEFPHSPSAWLAQHSNALAKLKQCMPRHAGGRHTTNTARERIQKMANRK